MPTLTLPRRPTNFCQQLAVFLLFFIRALTISIRILVLASRSPFRTKMPSESGVFTVNNKKKRAREESQAPSSSATVPTTTAKSSATSSTTERNRKKKQKKRSKKKASANKAQRKASKKLAGSDDDDDDEEDDDDAGMDSRQEVEALLLDGHRVGEVDKSGDDAALPPSKRQRDFSGDLKLYLDQWQAHQHAMETNNKTVLQYSPWKFNKVLQAWALDNCLKKDKIPLELFKQLLLYIATVRGGARERLRADMIAVIQEKDHPTNTDPEVAAEVKRSKKVLITLGKSDELMNV